MNSLSRWVLLAALAAFGVGCAPTGPSGRDSEAVQPIERPADDAMLASASVRSPAAALVFDLPVAADLPPLMLDRSLRQPSAFLGYDVPTVEYRSTTIDNVQTGGSGGYGCGPSNNGGGDGYYHEDVIQRNSVRYR